MSQKEVKLNTRDKRLPKLKVTRHRNTREAGLHRNSKTCYDPENNHEQNKM